jgi:hypothetical protein
MRQDIEQERLKSEQKRLDTVDSEQERLYSQQGKLDTD